MKPTQSTDVLSTVQKRYGQVGAAGLGDQAVGADAVAKAFGYSAAELASLPEGANLGLSCGNPTAMASLRPGEVVVDLGCGGGLDVFLAAHQVGPTGKAIGIDMTPEMITRAKANARNGPDGRPYSTVEFHLSTIDRIPLADATVDCIISNCVINLAPDKAAVFKEMFRVLRPGGRLAISDIALRQPLPKELADNVAAWVGCIAGAISVQDYRDGLLAAGFAQVQVIDSGADLNAYKHVAGQSGCCSPSMDDQPHAPNLEEKRPAELTKPGVSLAVQSAGCCGPAPSGVHDDLARLAEQYDLNAYAASVKIFAMRDSA